MSRSVRRRLRAALRPASPGGLWLTTAVIRLPAAIRPPTWGPGPSYVEAHTATVWASPRGDGQLHAVVRSYTTSDPYRPALLAGTITARDLLGLGWLCDKPHRIRWMATAGTLTETVLDDAHPAARYATWCEQLAERLDRVVTRGHRWPNGLGRLRVSGTPSGPVQIVVDAEVHPDWFAVDVSTAARALARVLCWYGPGTRLRFHLEDHEAVTDPLYHEACRLLRPLAHQHHQPPAGQ